MRRGRPDRSNGVLILIGNLPLQVDRRVRLECRSLIKSGFHVSVISPALHRCGRSEFEGVSIFQYPPPPKANGVVGFAVEFIYSLVMTALFSVWVAFSRGFHVIQACNPPDTYFLLAVIWKLFGKKFVFDQHDACPELYASRFSRPSRLLLGGLLWLERCSYRAADHVLSTNESLKVMATGRGGILESKTTIVRTGPDPQMLYRVAPDSALRRGKRYLCTYLGVMGPQDGVDRVVRAAEVLIKEMGREDCHFAVLGFGDCLEDIRRQVSVSGLVDHVEVVGRVDDDQVREYLSITDLGVCPDPSSPHSEVSTFNKTMEYMAFGVPVVGFALRENMVTAGDAGIFVPTDDGRGLAEALARLLDDKELRTRMGRDATTRVETTLAWAHQEPGYLKAFRDLLPAARREGGSWG